VIRPLVATALATVLAITGCGEDSARERAAGGGLPAAGAGAVEPVELAHFPLSDGGIPAGADAVFDPNVSQDGGGSLRVETSRGGRLRLYELDDLGIVQGAVVYTGFLRSRGLSGQAMLEMWCQPAEGDAAFVRGAAQAVAGDSDWTPQEIRFSDPELCRSPASIELNVLIQGSGTVWIDNLRLWSVPVG
jgi:hypothetical protein